MREGPDICARNLQNPCRAPERDPGAGVDLSGGGEPIELTLGVTLNVSGFSFGDISPDNRWVLLPSGDQGRTGIAVVSTGGDGATTPWS